MFCGRSFRQLVAIEFKSSAPDTSLSGFGCLFGTFGRCSSLLILDLHTVTLSYPGVACLTPHASISRYAQRLVDLDQRQGLHLSASKWRLYLEIISQCLVAELHLISGLEIMLHLS